MEGRKFGKKTREGIFAGYKCNAGGGWSGAYYVIDAERFQNKPANIRAHLFTVNEVHKLPELSFPVREGLWKPKPPVPKGDYRITEDDDESDNEFEEDVISVSYTHLTLPTNREV